MTGFSAVATLLKIYKIMRSINPRPPGGGGGGGGCIRPTLFFLNNVRNVTDVDAELSIPFRTSILHHPKFGKFLLKAF